MYKLLKYLIAALILAVSCESEVRELNINQAKYIDNFIQKYFADSTVIHIDGVTKIVIADNPHQAAVIEKGDSALLYYVGYTFSENGPAELFTTDSCTVKIGAGELIHGLDTGLPGTKQGQQVLLMFPAQYGYGGHRVGIVPENTALYFDVSVPLIIKKN